MNYIEYWASLINESYEINEVNEQLSDTIQKIYDCFEQFGFHVYKSNAMIDGDTMEHMIIVSYENEDSEEIKKFIDGIELPNYYHYMQVKELERRNHTHSLENVNAVIELPGLRNGYVVKNDKIKILGNASDKKIMSSVKKAIEIYKQCKI